MDKTSHETKDVWKSLLLLVVVANTVILEKSLTTSDTFTGWFLISIPLLILLFYRARQRV